MTTTSTPEQQTRRLPRVAGWVAFALAFIVASQGFVILLLGEGQTDRTLAITTIAIGLQTALLIWFAMRRGSRVTASVLWVFPAMLLAWSVHFLVNDDLAIGAPNLVFGVVAALALVIARPELTDASR